MSRAIAISREFYEFFKKLRFSTYAISEMSSVNKCLAETPLATRILTRLSKRQVG